jgi:hypothetical protein
MRSNSRWPRWTVKSGHRCRWPRGRVLDLPSGFSLRQCDWRGLAHGAPQGLPLIIQPAVLSGE